MKILGLSCYYHDSAAVILKDGKLFAAAEEERFSRKKHDSSFPKLSIEFCLKESGISSEELDYVIFYEKPFRKFHRIILTTLSTYPQSYSMFRETARLWLTKKLWIKQEISSTLNIPPSKILFSGHHLSHAASAFYPSPFQKAAILTVDGVGEWTTTAFGIGQDNKLKLLKQINFPHSLGLFYSAFTAFLGFEVNEGEWKVMGLAPYGKPKYADKIRRTIKQNLDGCFKLDLSYFSFHYSDKKSFTGKLIKLLGKPIEPCQSYKVSTFAADVAASVQVVLEEILLSMAKHLREKTKMDNLCLAGGVALNCVVNYRMLKESGFKNIYIQPAAGDSGGALGAALYLHHHILGNKKREIMDHAYWGQQWSNESVEQFIKTLKEFGGDTSQMPLADRRLTRRLTRVASGRTPGNLWRNLKNDDLTEYIAGEITKGKVVGWMQGKFEWGPRALGNRSILADPRNPQMKEIINAKVKFREAFRPFAPSV